MATIEEAKEIIDGLTDRHGYLEEEMMDDIGRFSLEYRRRIERRWRSMEVALSHSIRTLAKEIYGNGVRFVFELLQNADDNSFREAEKTKAPPFILFKVYRDRIIVDCNEDGFTKSDLDAICSIGSSTKSTRHGYTGAKGIGFKSVFIAAWKVHIQSRNFSFEFRHRKSDPGLGMVRPIWVNATETLEGPLTRMTLYLHNDGDPSGLQHLRKIIFDQLDELQKTCLLFLRRLERIDVESYDEAGHLKKSQRFRKRHIDADCVSVEKISVEDGIETIESQIYHLARRTATGLTPSESRKLSDQDGDRDVFTTAEVVLAFPLTDTFRPLIIKEHEVFAFLPVCESDYKFIIHSDFDTSAGREGIVATSKRNIELVDHVAKTFVDAVVQFNDYPGVCYDWPSFLPSTEEGSFGSLWTRLNSKILEEINATPVVKSIHKSALRLIRDVVRVPADARYQDSLPLLDDSIADPFLSTLYPRHSEQILKAYGLRDMTIDVLIDLLDRDLRSASSTMRGVDTGDEWHSAMAKALIPFASPSKHGNMAWRLQSLDLLPLADGRWVSAVSGPVYFPETNGFAIPAPIHLKIVKNSVVENQDRRDLFKKLGVSEAPVAEVRHAIFQALNTDVRAQFATLQKYCWFLYFTHGNQSRAELSQIQVISNQAKRLRPHLTDIYFPGTNHPYSPEALLARNESSPNIDTHFLHNRFLTAPQWRLPEGHPSWREWLRNAAGVRERLRLVSRDMTTLSAAFMYVFEHRNDQFLGAFEYLWHQEGHEIQKSRDLQQAVKDLPASQLCGVSFPLKLQEAWLPLPNLRHSVRKYMEHPEEFPFLRIEESDGLDTLDRKWSFLSTYFSVGRQGNISFLLQILRRIEGSCPTPSSVRQSQRVFELYVALDATLLLANDQERESSKIRDFFAVSGILIPDGAGSTWAASSEAVWLGPPDMRLLYSLRNLYARTLGDEQMMQIQHLFTRTLGIPAASLSDVVKDLQQISEDEHQDFGQIRGMYEYLGELEISPTKLRGKFAKTPLIYTGATEQGSWRVSTDCLWSSTTDIRGKVILEDLYEGMEDFFVGKLGVKSLTLQMVYDELLQGPQQRSVEEIQIILRTFNDLLCSEPVPLEPRPLLDARIFPVRYANGTVELCSANVDFAIGDRQNLRDLFISQVSILDFDLGDARALRPFFEWAGLDRKYLSASVTEKTIVSSHSANPIRLANRDLKNKAYHILRVAATFGSPQYEADGSRLYKLLRTAKTLETDDITSELALRQNSRIFKAPGLPGSVHLAEDSSGLTIYVPRNRRAQEICFSTVLPATLAKWLLRDTEDSDDEVANDEAVKVLTLIFAFDRTVLAEILDREGMVQTSVLNEDPKEDDIEGSTDQDAGPRLNLSIENTGSERQTTPIRFSLNPSSSPQIQPRRTSRSVSPGTQRRLSREFFERQSQMSRASHSEREPTGLTVPVIFGSPQPRAPPPFTPPVLRDERQFTPVSAATVASGTDLDNREYETILRHARNAAQQAQFPSQGAFDMSGMLNALEGQGQDDVAGFDGLDVVSRLRSSSQLERDKKIGAAGELYVFELLFAFQMPEFSRENWKSRIRAYVSLLEEYEGLINWRHRETADIVYNDVEGQFTEMLIDRGYLRRDEWVDARPKYYIEVKTTTGRCATPFYVSKNQFDLMGRVHRNEDRSEVYLICRVYSVSSQSIGMRVYLDPEQLRQNGGLVFTEHTWTVKPGTPGIL